MWGAELVEPGWDEGRRGHVQDHMRHGRGWAGPAGSKGKASGWRRAAGTRWELTLVWSGVAPARDPTRRALEEVLVGGWQTHSTDGIW